MQQENHYRHWNKLLCGAAYSRLLSWDIIIVIIQQFVYTYIIMIPVLRKKRQVDVDS